MPKKDKGYNIENVMISFRALTPILLLVCNALVYHLMSKIDGNTQAVNKMNTTLSALVAEKENLKDRVTRLEKIFDESYKKIN